MKRAFLFAFLALPAMAQVQISGNVQLSGAVGATCTNCVLTDQPVPQSMAGPLSMTYSQTSASVPFAVAGRAAFGFNASGQSEADWYTRTNGGLGVPAHIWWAPDVGGTIYQKIMTLDTSGNLSPAGDVTLTSANCYYFVSAPEGVCDDGSGGVAYATSATSTNGHRFYRGVTLQWQIDASGNLVNGSGQALLSQSLTGLTGTGNVVASNAPTLVNPIVGTQTVGDNSTKAASTAFVQSAVTAISSGVISINGTGGAFTFTGSVSCTATTCTFSSTGITNTTLALPAGLVAAANTCYGWSGSAWAARPTQAAATFTMTGVVVTPIQSNVIAGWQASPQGTTGWGKNGGLVLDVWASTANTVAWEVCNPTAGSITSGTPTFVISAQ